MLLGPGANMKRSPLGGRNFEYFSEDPFLAGEMAASLINGVQSQGVGTSLKHFAANNQEFQRFTISAEVDERTLREIYLPAFETAVKKAHPWTVMCAYNKLNGVYCSENYSPAGGHPQKRMGLRGPGRVRLGRRPRPGHIAARRAGLGNARPAGAPCKSRGRSGQGGYAGRGRAERIRAAHPGHGLQSQPDPQGRWTFDVDAHHELARQIAAEGMVLLKNNGLLPLKDHSHIAVIGRSAETAHFQGGGSSHINPTKVAMPFKELQKQAGAAELTYAEGYPKDNSFRQDLIDQAVGAAQTADVALLYIALPAFKESEGYDRPDLDLTGQQVALIKAVAKVQPNTVVILNNGAPVAMSEWIDDVAAVLEAWMMGQAGGAAIADVLFGRVNPSGKLAETFPLKASRHPGPHQLAGRQRRSALRRRAFSSAIAITMRKKCRCCSPLATG